MIPSAADIIEAINDYRIKFVEKEFGYELVVVKRSE